MPPSAQWWRWWAWHMRGGRRQAGKVQCRSRTTSAVHTGVVTSRRRRPRSRTSPWVPRTAGMTSASQASRRSTSGGRSVPSAVVPTRVLMPAASRSFLRVWWSRVTRSRAGVPWVSGGSAVVRACWAVVTRASHRRVPWSRGSRCSCPVSGSRWSGVGGGVGAGQRHQGGEEEGAVFGGAAAPEPDAAGAVGADREVAGRGGRRVPPARVRLRGGGRRCRGRPPRPGAVPPGRARRRPGSSAWRSRTFSPRRRTRSPEGRSSTDRTMMSACPGETVPSTRPRRVRVEGSGERSGADDPAFALTAAESAGVGEPVPGRPVVQPLFGEVSGVGLGDRPGLDRGQRRT